MNPELYKIITEVAGKDVSNEVKRRWLATRQSEKTTEEQLIFNYLNREYGGNIFKMTQKGRYSREGKLPEARKFAYYYFHIYRDFSLKQTGLLMGRNGMDHATILQGIGTLSDWIETDDIFKKKFDRIMGDLKEIHKSIKG